ncbi:hypothetical protein E0Z10_g5514 [Xylaria hypoxylon]|uniref:Uncharacterized protein n=1 Tax=Xylaria hypoxylon TaxID=37992 RepID=A0A4Z0YVQ1_9PEZI|nr:hypothetical protein E0Z10_g5514 [Xylaria hypoxylon]
MKLSYLLSVFLASLAVASPIAIPHGADDVNLTTHKYYYFTVEWPLGAALGDGDKESDVELKALQQQLGFEHIGVVVGQITETGSGKGKNKKTKRDFKSTLYHMTKKNKVPGDTEFKSVNYRADSKGLTFRGETSKKKADGAKKAGKDYVNQNGIYKVQGNNCADFTTTVLSALN